MPLREEPSVEVSRLRNDFAVRMRIGTETTIEVNGELDLATAPILHAKLDEIPYSSIRCVLLNLEDLWFIDASGLRAVLALHATCRQHAVQLSIRRGPRGVQRVFELTQTDLVLPFEPS
jgi:anti-anti-sigma factor